jgi:methyl-accepting chemotaxis protein
MSMNPGSRANEFARVVRNVEFLSPIGPLIASLCYLALAIDLSTMEWSSVIVCFTAYTICFGLVRISKAGNGARGIIDSLAARGLGKEREAGSSDASTASISVQLLALPLEMGRSRFLSMAALGIAMPCGMALIGFESWRSSSVPVSFGLGMLVASVASSALQYYWARSGFRIFRSELADELEGASSGDEKMQRVSLVHTLQAAIIIPTLLGLLLALNLVAEQQRASNEATALRWSQASLSGLLESGSDLGLAERIVQQNEIQKTWPLPIRLSSRSIDRLGLEPSLDLSEGLLDGLDAALANEEPSGTLVIPGAHEVAAFRRIDDRTVILATADRRQLDSLLVGGASSLALLIAGLLGIVWGLGLLVGRDLRGSLASLRTAARELEKGRSSELAFDTGDELGDLGHTLYGFGENMHRISEEVSSTLDQVEQTASDTMDLLGELAVSSTDQAERLQHTMDLVVSIDARGCEVSQSVETLNESVDESSSSIAELGAAGAELNETASILSSRVDEVSDSMEQMVRSVKQVGATTDKLAGASEDTSSSMEEMASAMRVVDTSAESMASLSLDVVAKAEVGQAKVCQTIEGMEAIREATDAAERVIRGLGSRTLEIGGILDVIDDVADETNLLALNAAIIAAQAGEQGKAFSVVADEIKELADRVLASTKEIGGLIRSVQEESENAIGAIEAGSQSVMSGVDLSAEAGRTLEEITEASRQNGVRIGEIVTSVREQTKAAGHVVKLMEKVRDSADEISTASGEQDRGNEVIYRSALTMREVAQQVRRTTEEQSLGFGRIRESVEGVRSTVEHINGALREQAGACGEVSTFLQQACEGTRNNDDAFDRLGGAMKEVLARAKSLREDVERSQISSSRSSVMRSNAGESR